MRETAKKLNIRKAAAALDMDATTLSRLAKKLGVEPQGSN